MSNKEFEAMILRYVNAHPSLFPDGWWQEDWVFSRLVSNIEDKDFAWWLESDDMYSAKISASPMSGMYTGTSTRLGIDGWIEAMLEAWEKANYGEKAE